MGTRETLSVEDGREHGRADGEESRARGALVAQSPTVATRGLSHGLIAAAHVHAAIGRILKQSNTECELILKFP
jgi:hypothetical protein